MRYHIFDHTADLGLHVFGRTGEELFINGAYALFDLMADLEQVQLTTELMITAAGTDWHELWVNYLRECLAAFYGAGLLIGKIDILSLGQKQVTARLRGEIYNPARHRIKQEIKAVTYHRAALEITAQGWKGEVILDV